ncbi:MAG: DUF1501 domain-containing protein [Planctomycetota bacterium]|nr:MAG: DUF1501 domain-containing protein [Planctomycetota bacterium]
MIEQSFSQWRRRHFLRDTACGLGGIALADLLARDLPAGVEDNSSRPLAPKPPHHAPTAKNVIFLFMAGAPSQLDLFDPKPALVKHHGEPVPESYLSGLKDSLIKGSARLFGSPRTFNKHGECGMDFSDFLPNLATCADDLCMIRSVHTDISNHHPAQLMMNCGVPRFGLPSMGSWATYGLGSESDDLPGFVVMLSQNGDGDIGGAALWDSAFLPSTHRGVTFRSHGDPILHLSSPPGVTPQLQRDKLDLLGDLNRMRFEQHNDPEIASRIAAYELAFRMQTTGPELIDFSDETQQTLDAYGVGDELKNAFGSNCLLARRMVERGVRFVQLYHFTWDDHSDLNNKLADNCRRTEQGVAALIKDLRQRGLLDDTLIVWGGEFGRTPMNEVRRGINPGKEGRDHHPFAFTMLMAGGGVKSGYIHGRTDELGYHAAEDPVHVHDMQATILHCLGIDHTRLTYRHQGRDFRLTDVAGRVIEPILA